MLKPRPSGIVYTQPSGLGVDWPDPTDADRAYARALRQRFRELRWAIEVRQGEGFNAVEHLDERDLAHEMGRVFEALSAPVSSRARRARPRVPRTHANGKYGLPAKIQDELLRPRTSADLAAVEAALHKGDDFAGALRRVLEGLAETQRRNPRERALSNEHQIYLDVTSDAEGRFLGIPPEKAWAWTARIYLLLARAGLLAVPVPVFDHTTRRVSMAYMRPIPSLDEGEALVRALYARGYRGLRLTRDPIWALLKFTELDVDHLLYRLHQDGRLEYQRGGDTIRLEIPRKVAR